MDFSRLQCYLYGGSGIQECRTIPGRNCEFHLVATYLFSSDAIGDLLQKCRGLSESEGFMFETPEEIKEKGSKGLWIGIAVAVAVVAVGAYFFIRSRGIPIKQASAASAPAVAKGNADPVHDLKIQRATMNKDRNGTMAVWLVAIENKSSVYSYSKIA